MNAVPLDAGLVLQFSENLLWALVYAVVVLLGVELVCVVALWVLDGKQGNASRQHRRLALKLPRQDLCDGELPAGQWRRRVGHYLRVI